MQVQQFNNYLDNWNKYWLANSLNYLVLPKHTGPDLVGNNYVIEIKAKKEKRGIDILAEGHNVLREFNGKSKFYAIFYYDLKIPVQDIKSQLQVFTSICNREVFLFDFDYVDSHKSEVRMYKHKRKSLAYYFLSLQDILGLFEEMNKNGTLETMFVTTFGRPNKIHFCTENAEELKSGVRNHPKIDKMPLFQGLKQK